MIRLKFFTLLIYLFSGYCGAKEFEKVSISYTPSIHIGLKQKVKFNFMQKIKNKFIADYGPLIYDDIDFFIEVELLYTVEILKVNKMGDAVQSRVIFEKANKKEGEFLVKYPLIIGESYLVELSNNEKSISLNGKNINDDILNLLNLLPSAKKEKLEYQNVLLGVTIEKETTGFKNAKIINGYQIFYEKVSDRIDKIEANESKNNNFYVFEYNEFSKHLMDENSCKQTQSVRSEIEVHTKKICEISLDSQFLKKSVTNNNRIIKTQGYNKEYQSNGYGVEETFETIEYSFLK